MCEKYNHDYGIWCYQEIPGRDTHDAANYCPHCGEPLDWRWQKPLTLDELRERDGKPVWVVFKGDEYSEAQSHWCFVSGGDVYPCDWLTVNDYTYPLNGFGGANTNLCAYDRPPKEG